MRDASIKIDLNNKVSVVKQITDQIRTVIVEGTLAPGDLLPPVRRLATDLGVHFNTVAEAYRGLSEEGWLTIVHGRGATVKRREMKSDLADTELVAAFRERMRHLLAEERSKGLSAAQIARELITITKRLEIAK